MMNVEGLVLQLAVKQRFCSEGRVGDFSAAQDGTGAVGPIAHQLVVARVDRAGNKLEAELLLLLDGEAPQA